jgi:birA, biotin-[acetyl-CoA-carboxylase] ligase region
VSICFAQEQTAGRGRGGKSWFSPPGGNLYFSLSWSFHQPMTALSGLSLMVGVVIAEVLSRTYGITSIGLKWPNDIYSQHQKLAGILIESANTHTPSQRVVIGVGINLMASGMSDAPIDQPFTTIENSLGFIPCRNQLALDLLIALLTQLPRFAEHGFALFQSRFAHYDKLKNQHVTLKVSGKTLTGVAQGVDETGRLILATPTQVYHLSSAEITQCRFLGIT